MHQRRHGVPILGLLLLTVCVQGRVSAADAPPQGALQPTMRAIFQALTQVFPWSLAPQQFEAPWRPIARTYR